MTRCVSNAVTAASLLVAACGIPVDIDVQGDTTGLATTSSTVSVGVASSSSTGEPVTSTTDTSTGDPVLPVRNDFAIRFADLPDGASGESGTASGDGGEASGGSGGIDSDPDALVIFATTGFGTCEEPYGQLQCPPATWTVGFQLPPALQFEGATGVLDGELNAGFSEVSGDDPDDCAFGGGTLTGRFEISAIDDTHVAGRMFDLEITIAGAEVIFDAVRCAG